MRRRSLCRCSAVVEKRAIVGFCSSLMGPRGAGQCATPVGEHCSRRTRLNTRFTRIVDWLSFPFARNTGTITKVAEMGVLDWPPYQPLRPWGSPLYAALHPR